ncbi:MAG: hypothetical protein AAGG11_15690, partial [Pseudomonadota bacterium]
MKAERARLTRVGLALLVSSLADLALAGSAVGDIQAVIDGTVWRTFQNAFHRMDGAALNSVYADTVLRVTPDGLDTQGNFKQDNLTRFLENRARGDRIELDFWFDSRHTNAAVSYDVGFYRVRVVAASGESSDFFGQFHIVVRKINGCWKIVQDWD